MATKNAKPDYIDLDKDGNKKEPMKNFAFNFESFEKNIINYIDNKLVWNQHDSPYF